MGLRGVLRNRIGWDSAIGIAWLLGMWFLLGWASPVEGQAPNRSEGLPLSPITSGVLPQQTRELPVSGPRNGFWPLGAKALGSSPLRPSLPPPLSTHFSHSEEKSASPAQQRGASPEKTALFSSEGTSLYLAPKESSAPTGAESPLVDSSVSRKTEAGPGSRGPSRLGQLREGFRISHQKGTFTLGGGRVVFSALDGTLPKMVVLENLNLQRVIQNLQGNPHQEIWLITGRVTEFQGANYLLLERAIRIDEADLAQLPSAAPAASVQPTPSAMPSSANAPLAPTSAAAPWP